MENEFEGAPLRTRNIDLPQLFSQRCQEKLVLQSVYRFKGDLVLGVLNERRKEGNCLGKVGPSGVIPFRYYWPGDVSPVLEDSIPHQTSE